LDSAKVYYEKALLLDPKNTPANNNMGWLLRAETRQFDQALIYFRRRLSYDPKFFNAYNGISRVFTDLRMFDSARAYSQKAMKNYPDKLITSNYIGQFYQDQNQVIRPVHIMCRLL
jgi:tetratricopeptide (TPR) repeat protein